MVVVETGTAAVPVSLAAVWTDDECVVEFVCRGCQLRVGEVDTSVGGEFHLDDVFESYVDVFNALYALVVCHVGPFEVQIRTGCMV